MAANILRSYNAALIRRPMLTQCLTAGVLFGAGDLIAQQAVERKGRDHDWTRTARLTFYGGAIFGPAMTKWYQLLNQLKFASPTRALAYRVFLDQAVLTPVAVAFFYGAMSCLEGKPEEVVPRVQAAYVPTLIRNWGVYIPTQIINFSLVPPHLRLVVVSVVSLFWNTYLSAANASVQKESTVTGTSIEKVEVSEF
ncbi:Protein SYM1 [Psilocybe cubensis]|uniref:Protein SYM1 n=2 Tax=Psilocybe cubensis TaxID=181762 RepID=A0ACB8GJX2_PSICU|nr:Protein SYM1 [Psilocybe cubensis]KAH9475697.1 Protein SYM1 [Psilocybe cubensis]